MIFVIGRIALTVLYMIIVRQKRSYKQGLKVYKVNNLKIYFIKKTSRNTLKWYVL